MLSTLAKSSVSSASKTPKYLAVALDVSPWLAVYPISSSSGISSKFSDPSTLPSGKAYFGQSNVKFNSTGTAVICGNPSQPGVNAYRFSSSGFGTKYSNPATNPADYRFFGNSIAFSPLDNYVTFCGSTYKWTNASGFGTRLSTTSYSTQISEGSGQIAFHPTETAITYTLGNAGSKIQAYAFSASGIGTAYSNPASYPTAVSATTYTVFGNTGNYVALSTSTGFNGGVSLWIWPFSLSTGFGTLFTPPFGGGTSIICSYVAFNSNDTAVITSSSFSSQSRLYYKFSSSGYGTAYTAPTAPVSWGNGAAFARDDSLVAIGDDYSSSPGFALYPWSNSTGFGSPFSWPSSYATGRGQGVTIF